MSITTKNRNSVIYDSGSGLGDREYNFMVWPSIGLRVMPEQYIAVVEFLREASDVFFDGELIIIPEEDRALKEEVENRFEVISVERESNEYPYQNGFGDEFATKAIQHGVAPTLVVLGSSLRSFVGSADSMVEEALREPEKAKLRWTNIYLSSMSEQ